MNFYNDLGGLALAVVCLRQDGQFHLFACCLPFVSTERSLQGGVSHVHPALPAARFTGGVRHVRSNGVVKCRLVFLGNGTVRLCDELDVETTVVLRLGCAVGDLLGTLRGHWPPPKAIAPPSREAHLSRHAPAHFCSAHRCAGVGGCLAVDAHFLIQLSR